MHYSPTFRSLEHVNGLKIIQPKRSHNVHVQWCNGVKRLVRGHLDNILDKVTSQKRGLGAEYWA